VTTIHVYALSGRKDTAAAHGLRDENGKSVAAFCGYAGLPGRLVFPDDQNCDVCALIRNTAIANIGENTIRRPPFTHGGTYTLATWFFAHRILGTYPTHPAWNRWALSPAFRHLQSYIAHAQIFVGCLLCGAPWVQQFGSQHCRICLHPR